MENDIIKIIPQIRKIILKNFHFGISKTLSFPFKLKSVHIKNGVNIEAIEIKMNM